MTRSKLQTMQFYRSQSGIVNKKSVNTRTKDGVRKTYWSSKSDIIKGDHVTPLSYSTQGGRMTSSSPHRIRQSWSETGDDGKTVVYYNSNIFYEEYDEEAMYTANPLPGLDNTHAEALTKSLNELVQNAQSFGASIGEGSETMKMFVQNGIILTNSMIAAKRGQWSKIPDILGMNKRDILTGVFPANKYLEYKYGWQPLMSDLHGLQEKLHEKDLRKQQLIRATATASTTEVQSTTKWGGNAIVKTTGSTKSVLFGSVARPDLAKANSWGLINPLSVAWELVPFSFAIDWLMPIGNTLSALTATAGLDFFRGYINRKESTTVTQIGETRFDNYMYPDEYHSGGSFGATSWSFERSPLSQFPLPQIYVTNPFMNKKGEAKVGRLTNALALLRSLN